MVDRIQNVICFKVFIVNFQKWIGFWILSSGVGCGYPYIISFV